MQAQGGGRGEPAAARDLLDRQPSGFEQLLRAQHALVGQPGQRRVPGDLAEPPVEVAPVSGQRFQDGTSFKTEG